jgi:hypothetical protein
MATKLTWILFAMFATTAPVVLFLGFAGGLLPLGAAPLWSWLAIPLALPQIAVQGYLYYLIARTLARRIVVRPPVQTRWLVFFVAFIVAVIGMLPIYTVGGPGGYVGWMNAYEAYRGGN